MPADLVVRRQHLVADLCGLHVPARLRVVEKRRVAAPAMRIRVQVSLRPEQPAPLIERADDVRIGLLDEPPREVGDALVEAAAVVYWVLKLDPVLLAQSEVVLAEGDRCMD